MAQLEEEKLLNDKTIVETPLEDESLFVASQWQLIWRKFKKHKVALGASVIIIIMYLFVIFAEIIAPFSPHERNAKLPFAPPQRMRFIDDQGKFHIVPFVYGLSQKFDLQTFQRIYTIEKDKIYPLGFFVRGAPYKLWGIIRSNIHFYGPKDPEGPFFLLGTDKHGRDLLSRSIYGARLSLSIGFIGVVVSFVLGIIMGGISGYFGGVIDTAVQRFIEVLRSMPTLPLWMALAASLPTHWSVVKIYFFITLILSVRGWTGMARVVRGKFLALREEDFVVASRVAGASNAWIIGRHMVPAFLSHIIASATLSIPNMIIGETSLSFLGVGLRAPAISWGVLLQDAQNVQSVVSVPWMLLPALFVIITVLAFNFVGDGLRDAADPYII